MFTTDHIINIQKINNHQVNNISIITATGVVSTQKREIVVLMYQYTHSPKNKIIYISGQLEHFGFIIDDRTKFNGKY